MPTKEPNFIEKSFVVITLILLMGGPIAVLLSGGASEGSFSYSREATDYSLLRYVFLVIYVITFFLLIRRWKKALYVLSKNPLVTILLALLACSTLWSYNPSMTFNRSVMIIGTTLFGLYLATFYSLKQLFNLLIWSVGLIIGLSFFYSIALPQYGIEHGVHAGAWRGIFTHKNTLGKIMLLGAIVCLPMTTSKKHRTMGWVFYTLSVILIVLSQSSSALVNLCTLTLIFLILCTFRLHHRLVIPAASTALATGIATSWLVANNSVQLLGLIGKDTTLTGRTEIWPAVMEMIYRRPWLGYGYEAFWQGWRSPAANVWREVGWTPPNSHNGLLDLGLELGLIGILIFLLGFLLALWSALLQIRQSNTPESFLPILFLSYFTLANITESSLLGRNSIYWALYVCLSLLIAYQKPASRFSDRPLLFHPSESILMTSRTSSHSN